MRTIPVMAIAWLLVSAAFGATPVSSGASQLGPPIALTGPTGYPQAQIAAASANGVEAFAWTQLSTSGHPNGRSRIQARLRRVGGRLTATQTVSASSRRAYLPAIGVDRAGRATVAWLERRKGRRLALEVAVQGAGGRFSGPRTVGFTTVQGPHELDESNPSGAGPQLVVSPDGAAVLAWRGTRSMQVAVRRPGRCAAAARRACFSAPRSFPYGRAPQVIFGKRDSAYLLWRGPRGIELAVAGPARGFGAARVLSPAGESTADPSIAVTPDGAAVVAWCWGPRGSSHPSEGIEVASRSAAGVISTPARLSAPPTTSAFGLGVSGPPTVLVDPHGEALIDWAQVDYTIAESVRASNGELGPARVIGRVLGNDPMVMDARGDTVLAYLAGPYDEAFWSVRPSEGTFGPSVLLANSGSGPPFLLERTGDVVTIGWTTPTGTRLSDIRITEASPAAL
jgi:hypothetical protein